jgi:hypothetical protein
MSGRVELSISECKLFREILIALLHSSWILDYEGITIRQAFDRQEGSIVAVSYSVHNGFLDCSRWQFGLFHKATALRVPLLVRFEEP